MKETICGDPAMAEKLEENSEQTCSLQAQDKAVRSNKDDSRTSDIKEESLNSESNVCDVDKLVNDNSNDKIIPPNSPSGCKGTSKSKSNKDDEVKEHIEVENVSPEQPERRSSRLRGKRPKLTEIITTSDEEEFCAEDDSFERKEKDRKRGKKSVLAKYMQRTNTRGKQKKSSESIVGNKDAVSERQTQKKSEDIVSKPPKDFTSGAFVVLKSDFHSTSNPPIWKIDGKALLQKYVHFEQDGQTLYKNTSTYSGWTPSNQDQYYPASVEFKSQNRQETVIRFNREAIIADESD